MIRFCSGARGCVRLMPKIGETFSLTLWNRRLDNAECHHEANGPPLYWRRYPHRANVHCRSSSTDNLHTEVLRGNGYCTIINTTIILLSHELVFTKYVDTITQILISNIINSSLFVKWCLYFATSHLWQMLTIRNVIRELGELLCEATSTKYYQVFSQHCNFYQYVHVI